MTGRKVYIGLVLTLAITLSSCGTTSSTQPLNSGPLNSGTATGAGQMSPGMPMADRSTLPANSTQVLPSASALMVCSEEIRRNVATALALAIQPTPSSTWIDHLYTCTYRLSSGSLVFSVKESTNVPAARLYAAGLRQRLSPTQPLKGAAALGLLAYESSTGAVVFVKDDKTLEVDASDLSNPIGPYGESQMTFAYQMATDVLGCWSGK